MDKKVENNVEVRLENWSTQSNAEPYTPPECVRLYLVGDVQGDSRFPDGHSVRTSRIVTASGKKVTTRGGTTYVLGEPDPNWVAWMELMDIPFDPEQPITVK